MKTCPNCNRLYSDVASVCPKCGVALPDAAAAQPAQPVYTPPVQQPAQPVQQPAYTQPAQPVQQPTYTQPAQPVQQPAQPVQQPATQAQTANAGGVPYVSTGGLIFFSVVTLLLCFIPGIVALANACNVNKCATVEEQEKKIKACKTWCWIGCIIGVLVAIGSSGVLL